MKYFKYPFIAFLFLAFAILACGGEETAGKKVGESGKRAATVAAPEFFAVGDVIEVSDHTIVLNSAAVKNNILQANFTIENEGSDEMIVSSLLDFDARNDDGTKLEQAIFDCPSGSLGGDLIPGDRMRGYVCWKAASLPCKIYYSAELFGSTSVVWRVER